MTIHFDSDVACIVGMKSAVLFESICYWIDKNEKNERHFHDGCYWTYNSVKAFSEQYPFMTKKETENAIKKLHDFGLVKFGEYNDNRYDRTRWFSLTEFGKEMSPCNRKAGQGHPPKGELSSEKGEIEFPEKGTLYNNIYNSKSTYTDNIPNNIPNNSTEASPLTGKCPDSQETNGSRNTETKHKHGQYGHVLLTDTEYEKLTNTFGQHDTDGMIQFLDDAIEMKGYKYKRHYLVIAKEDNWVRKEYFKNNGTQPRTQGNDNFTRY